ncbi:hypothetical protein NYZ99_07475 [Maribacter litopenaei]|uniref:Uncharacterized protein n=1 Tax=Maribacter litopenaei TaxID=2976127 RepID=A0ABY5YAP6_9FLAO|nr:hypothetical protein [Maribacter litopenaei]UWX56125.1 hypothetical protein NYZ99_07475 [Maribacter litopenaei]
MLKKYSNIFLWMLLALPYSFFAQEVRIFTVSDFDLKDSVKTCLGQYKIWQRGI